MTKLVIDQPLVSKLNNLTGQVELCDGAGQVVGYFLPAGLLHDWAEANITDEELERRRSEPGGHALTEIWSRLKGA